MTGRSRTPQELATARLVEAARVLGAPVTASSPHDRRAGQVEAERSGAVVTVVARPSTTAILVKLPVAPADVILDVRAQGVGAPRSVREGDSVDVTVGDPIFDPAFHVEGAPNDVVRAVLDAPFRSFMLARRICHLELTNETVRFLTETLPVEDVEATIETVLRFALSLPVAVHEVALARERPAGGGTYRARESSVAIERRHTRARVELDRLSSMRNVGSIMIPGSMAVAAAGHIALVAALLPWKYALLSLLVLPATGMLGGTLLYIAAAATLELTGIAGFVRRRRKHRFDRLEAATAEPPDE